MDREDARDSFVKFANGEISAKEMAENMMAYFTSPEWRQREAAQAAEALKAWKAGRERLWQLIEKARADGYQVETEFVPIGKGHDSVVVHVEGCGTGFPSFFDIEFVEQNFADILEHADERKAHRMSQR